MRAGLVSTVIPVYNRPQMIREAVASVLAQDYPALEVIIVDDGSTDDTPAVLTELAAEDARVHLAHQTNQGPGTARQLGTTLSQGEYIQFLDSDDLLLPGKFSAQVKALQGLPLADVAYGKTECIGFSEPLHGLAYRRTGEVIPYMYPLFLNERWWSTSTPLYRRKAVDAIGPWLDLINEEDWEFDCRIAARGNPLARVDNFVSVRRMHDENISHGGGVEPAKLKSRCEAREAIYRSARTCPELLEDKDWQEYSKAVFLLARECAQIGLSEQVDAMLALSIEAWGHPRSVHRLFSLSGKAFGWRLTMRFVRCVEKVRTRLYKVLAG